HASDPAMLSTLSLHDALPIYRRIGRAHHDVHRSLHRRGDVADRGQVPYPGRIEHVGAGLLEGLQPLDRVVQVEATVQQILGPSRDRKSTRLNSSHGSTSYYVF